MFELTSLSFKLPVIVLLFFISCQQNLRNEWTTNASGLQIRILEPGNGPMAELGDTVYIRETTSYLNGTVLYSNEQQGSAIPVIVGAGQVLKGIEETLRTARKEQIKELRIPAELARREIYPDHISPDSALHVKLIIQSIHPAPK